MSREYDIYLDSHKAGVVEGFRWLQKYLPELFEGLDVDLEHQICFAHDASKNDPEEYTAYDAYFYGGNRSFDVVDKFRYAWLRHIHKNKHHWQYWVLLNDDEGMMALDMPYHYIIEMICDWWSFSWREGSLGELFTWYEQHKPTMILSNETRMMVEYMLHIMKEKLVELGEIDVTEDDIYE